MTLKKLFSMAAALTVLCSFAAEKTPEAAPAEQRKDEKTALTFRGGKPHRLPGRRQENMIWHAFSRMSEAERHNMMKLQRIDPEKFRAEMSERAEKIARERRERMQELQKMAEAIRNCKDENTGKKLRIEFTAELKKDYLRHIENSRRQLEEMKERAEKLEKELNRRLENADKAVEFRAKAMISGKVKRPHRPRGSFNHPDKEGKSTGAQKK